MPYVNEEVVRQIQNHVDNMVGGIASAFETVVYYIDNGQVQEARDVAEEVAKTLRSKGIGQWDSSLSK